MKEKVFLSWQWVDKQIATLTSHVSDSVSELRYVTGIPRGGLIPGAYLSHSLGLKYIQFEEAKNLPANLRAQVLVVDDICDSGYTLLETMEFGFKTATLSLRYSSPFIPDFYGEKIKDDRWLVFPWEKIDSETIQGYLA